MAQLDSQQIDHGLTFEAVIELLDDGVVVIGNDRSVRFINSAAMRILGLGPPGGVGDGANRRLSGALRIDMVAWRAEHIEYDDGTPDCRRCGHTVSVPAGDDRRGLSCALTHSH